MILGRRLSFSVGMVQYIGCKIKSCARRKAPAGKLQWYCRIFWKHAHEVPEISQNDLLSVLYGRTTISDFDVIKKRRAQTFLPPASLPGRQRSDILKNAKQATRRPKTDRKDYVPLCCSSRSNLPMHPYSLCVAQSLTTVTENAPPAPKDGFSCSINAQHGSSNDHHSNQRGRR